MTPEEKRALLREKLGIGDPLGPDDFTPDGRYLLPRHLRKKPIKEKPVE